MPNNSTTTTTNKTTASNAALDVTSNGSAAPKCTTAGQSLCWTCQYATGAPLKWRGPRFKRWVAAQLKQYPATLGDEATVYPWREGQLEERRKKQIKIAATKTAAYNVRNHKGPRPTSPEDIENQPPVLPPVNPSDPIRTCPWVRNYTPLVGWTATPCGISTKKGTQMNKKSEDGDIKITSYHITMCPLYRPDLLTQIEHIKGGELAARLNIPPRAVTNATRMACENILYTYIRLKGYYDWSVSSAPNCYKTQRVCDATDLTTLDLPPLICDTSDEVCDTNGIGSESNESENDPTKYDNFCHINTSNTTQNELISCPKNGTTDPSEDHLKDPQCTKNGTSQCHSTEKKGTTQCHSKGISTPATPPIKPLSQRVFKAILCDLISNCEEDAAPILEEEDECSIRIKKMAPKDTTSALLHSLLHLKAALIRVENARRNKIRATKNKSKKVEKNTQKMVKK